MHASKYEKLISKYEIFIKIFHSKVGFSSSTFSHILKNMIQHFQTKKHANRIDLRKASRWCKKISDHSISDDRKKEKDNWHMHYAHESSRIGRMGGA